MTFSVLRFLDHTQRRTTVGRTPLDEWSACRRYLYLTTLTTNTHALGGIRTHNLSRRADADLRLRPRGHWDRLCFRLRPPKRHLSLISTDNPASSSSCLTHYDPWGMLWNHSFTEYCCPLIWKSLSKQLQKSCYSRRQSYACFSLRGPGFDPTAVLFWVVVRKVTLRWGFLRPLWILFAVSIASC